jgi:hypothetical protein
MGSAAAFAGEEPQVSAEQEAQALKGLEFAPMRMEARLFDHLSCTLQGSGSVVVRRRVHEEWGNDMALCQGRYVMLLTQLHKGATHKENRWRVVDAAVLPEVVVISSDPREAARPPEGLYLYTPDECTLDGTWGTSFYAVVRLGKRKRMDWRTGVEGAWGYDLKRQRIVPISTKRVVCNKPEPD